MFKKSTYGLGLLWTTLLCIWALSPISFGGGENNLCSGEAPNGVLEAGEQCDDGNTEDGDGCSAFCRMELPNCDLVADNPRGSFVSWSVNPTEIELWTSVNFEFLFKTGFAGTLIEWGAYGEMGQLNPWTTESHKYENPGTYYPKIWVKNSYDKGGKPFVIACDLPSINVSAKCGDGKVHDTEQCDDGNTEDGDGCSSSCQAETPSCSFLENSTFTPVSWPQETQVKATVSLSPDTPDWVDLSSISWGDSNSDTISYDPNGTSLSHTYNNNGQFTPYFTLKNTLGNTQPTINCPVNTTITIASECGNTKVEPGEQCDDGNTEDGDGCSASCQWETPSCSALTANVDPKNGKPGTQVQANFSLNASWIEVSEINWWDGDRDQNPESPISHIYDAIDTYTPGFTLVNKKDLNSSKYCQLEEPIVISATCGNGEREGDEQCDGGAACTSDCKWKQPNAETILQSFSITPTIWTLGTKIKWTVSLKSWVADWITVKQIVWADETSQENPSLDDLTHIYNKTGTFQPYLIVVNQEAIDHWAIEISVRQFIHAEDAIVIKDAACGNTKVEPGEQCDDGNTEDGDGCSASCQWEKPDCSNLSLQLSHSGTYVPVEVQAKLSSNPGFQLESLDRWNEDPITIGSLSTLKHSYTKHGRYIVTLVGKNMLSWANITWSCQKELILSHSICWDKKIEHLEQCDDGNSEDGDGCSSSCQLETIDCQKIQPEFKKSTAYLPLTVSFSLSPFTWFRFSSLDMNGQIKTATGTDSLSGSFSTDYTSAGSHVIKIKVENLLSGEYTKECSYTLNLSNKPSSWGGSSSGIWKWWSVGTSSGSFIYVASCWNGKKDGRELCDLGGEKIVASDGKLFTNTNEFDIKYKGYTCTSACKLTKKNDPIKVDDKVWLADKEHRSADFPKCEVKDTTKYPKSLIEAFMWSYQHKITTVCPIEKANLDGSLLRRHMAKMISEFAIQVLNMKPDTKKKCNFQDISDQTPEMKWYIKLSCQLGVMGYHADGKTKKANFDPNKSVSKAQFATLLSRLLWWSTFDNDSASEYWKDHLKALENAKITEKESSQAKKVIQKRWGVLKMLKNAYEYKTTTANK